MVQPGRRHDCKGKAFGHDERGLMRCVGGGYDPAVARLPPVSKGPRPTI